jgi:hypothetical protein
MACAFLSVLCSAPAGTSAYSKYMANLGGLDKVAQERGFSNRADDEGAGVYTPHVGLPLVRAGPATLFQS